MGLKSFPTFFHFIKNLLPGYFVIFNCTGTLKCHGLGYIDGLRFFLNIELFSRSKFKFSYKYSGSNFTFFLFM